MKYKLTERDEEALHRIGLPNIEEGLKAYVEEHRPTGGFLRRCLIGDLFGAVAKADNDSLSRFGLIVQWIVWYAPASCCGSQEAYDNWIKDFTP